MHSIGQCALLLGTTVLTVLAISDPAFAQIGGTRPLPGPAPLIGIGLPVAALAFGAVWLVRRYGKN